MGIALDSNNMRIYTCSIDKTFYVTDFKKKNERSKLISTNVYGYTNIQLDNKNKRIFLTNEGGELNIFTLEISPPSLVKNLKTSS